MELEIFKQRVISDIQNSGLSIGAAYYVMKDIMVTLEQEYQNYLIQIQAEREKEEGE